MTRNSYTISHFALLGMMVFAATLALAAGCGSDLSAPEVAPETTFEAHPMPTNP